MKQFLSILFFSPLILLGQIGITPVHYYDGELYLVEEHLFNDGDLDNGTNSLTWYNTINTNGAPQIDYDFGDVQENAELKQNITPKQ